MDLAINNGFVVDPKNGVYSKLNIGISNGRIQELSLAELRGEETVDAQGLVVSPGFIDAHMHEGSYDRETGRFEEDIFECMLRMGVTTAIGGNCGSGPDDPGEYLDAVDRCGSPVNLAMLVPHASLRKIAGAENKYAFVPSKSCSVMREAAEQYLSQGCIGISFGIRYIPGINREELFSVCSAAQQSRKVIAAHIRDDADKVIPSIKEIAELYEQLGIPVQVSHIGSMGGYGQMEELLSLLDFYKASGMDIAADCYPYTAFSTDIGETTYDEGFLERYDTGYENIEIAEGIYRGRRCTEELFRKLRAEAPDTITIGHVMKESEIDMAMAHPGVLVGSDGYLHKGEGHPRAAGTFPRVISEYVKKKKLLTLYDAVNKMSWQTAKRFGLQKGGLEAGSDADAVVFSLEEMEDRVTFENPTAVPSGIKYVIIKGQAALKDGKIINPRLGRAVRK